MVTAPEVPIFAISAHDTDWLLVGHDRLPDAGTVVETQAECREANADFASTEAEIETLETRIGELKVDLAAADDELDARKDAVGDAQAAVDELKRRTRGRERRAGCRTPPARRRGRRPGGARGRTRR